MKTGLITSNTYKNHNTGEGHPERIDRVSVIINNFKKLNNKNLIWKKPSKFSKDLLIKTHNKNYIKPRNEKLGKNSDFFSYPFGEYSINFQKIIKSFGFKYAFGQHSGVIDETKNFYELPRFPINEKYGEIKRFTSLTKTLPFKYKKLIPEEKFLIDKKNPPKVEIEFFENITNLKSLNCYSNEGNKWRKSSISFTDKKTLKINISEKFIGERGRINCSLKVYDGFWRWLGIQFVIAED